MTIIGTLKKIGFKTTESGTTPGARKTWMKIKGTPMELRVKDLVNRIKNDFPEKTFYHITSSYGVWTMCGEGFEITINNGYENEKREIFVARYTRASNMTRVGTMYEAGMDC